MKRLKHSFDLLDPIYQIMGWGGVTHVIIVSRLRREKAHGDTIERPYGSTGVRMINSI